MSELLYNIRFVDIVDIAIVAILIYSALTWFERTRARLIFVGITILTAIYFLARLFNLYLTTMVFRAFFAIFVIALVVIFQEELRRFFERLAMWGSLRKNKWIVSSATTVDIISESILNIAKKRHGAIIIVQGKDPLERHLTAGVILNGAVSGPLIESIFDPHSRGHDGAVVIENDQVSKFGCRLPLSENQKEIGGRGTRHAAALGLSERTDALCIVVSEESGDISIAEGDRIYVLSQPAELKGTIEKFYQMRFPKEEKKGAFSWIVGGVKEKAVAIILACVLWMIFGYQAEVIRRDFNVPIEYRGIATDLVVEEQVPKEITVTLSGSERAFAVLDVNVLKISFDMASIKEGKNLMALSKDLIRHPPNLVVLDIKPEKVELRVRKVFRFALPIEIKTQGALPSGLVLKAIKASPDSITLKSLKAKQEDAKIITEPIALDRLTDTSILTPKLILPRDAEYADLKQPEVKVTIEVEKLPSPPAQ